MMKHVSVCGVCCLLMCLAAYPRTVQSDDKSYPATISGQWFLSYQHGDEGSARASRFVINRGYITVKKQLDEHISGRITPDISVDREGDGEGDLEMRLKYCYINIALDPIGVLTSPNIEFGLVHRPWLGYEENIVRYRVQGSLFLERNGVFNSADFGVLATALLGGEIDERFQEGVNSRVPGRYGSVAFGLYNGGGYHAIEQNENKSFESRITLRPLPDHLPGLQVSYTGVIGKGNTAATPDWRVHSAHVSYEDRIVTLAAQYYSGDGDYKGEKVDAAGDAIDMTGYSLFGELHLPVRSWRLFSRYDYFDDRPDTGAQNQRRIIAGASWSIAGNSRAVFDYDITTRDSWSDPQEAYSKFSIEYLF